MDDIKEWLSYDPNTGIFKTEEEAARAYDKKALELFGEYAFLNYKELSENGKRT